MQADLLLQKSYWQPDQWCTHPARIPGSIIVFWRSLRSWWNLRGPCQTNPESRSVRQSVSECLRQGYVEVLSIDDVHYC
jgi:hypothetical protein